MHRPAIAARHGVPSSELTATSARAGRVPLATDAARRSLLEPVFVSGWR